MNPEERAARRRIMWVARILMGLVLLIVLASVVKSILER